MPLNEKNIINIIFIVILKLYNIKLISNKVSGCSCMYKYKYCLLFNLIVLLINTFNFFFSTEESDAGLLLCEKKQKLV